MLPENQPTKITIEANGFKHSSELNWDASIDDLIQSFYGLCIAASWIPTTVLENMKSFAEEHLDAYGNNSDDE